jgi:CDP-glucose 4,6-dehydratase
MIAERQYGDGSLSGWYNVGPDDRDCFRTGELVDLFCELWGEGARWIDRYDGGPHEANFLKLDCSKLKGTFGWSPTWDIAEAVSAVVEWSKCMRDGGNVTACMDEQIARFIADSDWIEI